MTDGDVELIDDPTLEAFRTTGLAHLVAVSGSNVAVVLAIVVLLTRALVPRGRWLRAFAALPPLVFFAFLTGLEPSVLRAVFTAGIALAVTAGGRTSDGIRVAAFAFIGLVLTSPELLLHPGFQLSFGATLGLIVWARPLAERVERFLPAGKIGRATAFCVATTLSAQAAVAPLLAWHFGRVPALGGVANLVVAPLAPVVMLGGAFTLGAASLVGALEWAPAMLSLPLDAILACARWFAALPAASLAAGVCAGLAVTAALAALAAPTHRLRIASGTLVIALAAVACGQALAREANACTGSAVHALDIGQGTAVLLKTNEHAVLVDTGPPDGGVVRALKALGVTGLDAVFVSHAHTDHALGAVDVLHELDVGRLFGPVTLFWGAGRQVLEAASEAQVAFAPVSAGDAFDAGPLHIEVLWPPPGPAPAFSEDLVDPFSLVLRADLDGTNVLLPGDIRAEQQAKLIGEPIAAPVMIGVHHGSKNLDEAFVDTVEPRMTVITVGSPNPYGLPAPEAVRTYASHGPVFRTDQNGRVSVCLTDGRAEVLTERTTR
jgi:competence protein ComEC